MTRQQLMLWILGLVSIVAIFVSLDNTMAAVAGAAQEAQREQAAQMIDGPYRRYFYGGVRQVKDGTVVVIRVAYLPLVGDQTQWKYDRIYCPKADVVLTPNMEPGDPIKGFTRRCSYHLSDFDR